MRWESGQRIWIRTNIACTPMEKNYSRRCCESLTKRSCRFLWRALGLRSIPTWTQLESRGHGDRSYGDDCPRRAGREMGRLLQDGDQESAAGSDGVCDPRGVCG